MLKYALAIDMPESVFWQSTMRRFNTYKDAYEIKQKVIDNNMWVNGIYAESAFATVLSNAFSKGSKAKYVEKPFREQLEEKNKVLTEDELQKQRELFVAKLKIMQTNFNLTHKKKQGDSNGRDRQSGNSNIGASK